MFIPDLFKLFAALVAVWIEQLQKRRKRVILPEGMLVEMAGRQQEL